MGDDHATPGKYTTPTASKGSGGSSQVLWGASVGITTTSSSTRDIATQSNPFPVSSIPNIAEKPKEDIFHVLKRVLKTRRRYSAFSPIPFPLELGDNRDSGSGIFLQEDDMIRLRKNPEVEMYLVQTGKPQALLEENDQAGYSTGGPQTSSTDLEAFLQFHSKEKYKVNEMYDEIQEKRRCAAVVIIMFLSLIMLSVCFQSFAAIWTFGE